MGDLIEKIGRFFADQEAQIQHAYSLVQSETQVNTQASQVKAPAAHRIPHEVHAAPSPALAPVLERRSSESITVEKPSRSLSLLRRRLSFQESTAGTVAAFQRTNANSTVSSSTPRAPPQTKLSSQEVCTPAMVSSSTAPSTGHDEKRSAWRYRRSESLGSWRSSSTDVSSDREDDLLSLSSSAPIERQRKPRPPRQNVRKRTRKKKSCSSSTSSPSRRESARAQAEALAKANAEKVAAALTVAKERAKRIQQDKLRLARERELEREQAEYRLQQQMTKIEAVRAKTLRNSPRRTPDSTPRSLQHSGISVCGNGPDSSVVVEDHSHEAETLKQDGAFLATLEAQVRERMSLEMNIKERCLKTYQQREQVRVKLGRVLQRHATQQAKVQRLAATKAALEKELTSVLEEGEETRRHRRELEETGKKERLRRQREEECALHMRLREEEWSSMMNEEKERSEIAAEARVKAGKRVEARSADLRKRLQAYRYEPSRSRVKHRNLSSNNNNSEATGSDSESDSEVRNNEAHDSSECAQVFKLDFYLLPDLAGFEEDGICTSYKRHPPFGSLQPELSNLWGNAGLQTLLEVSSPTQKYPSSSSLSSTTPSYNLEPAIFVWEVPPFPSKARFDAVLLEELVSDDEAN